MRYVVFVNGREREVIMQDMRRRIDRGDLQAEIKEAVEVSAPSVVKKEAEQADAGNRLCAILRRIGRVRWGLRSSEGDREECAAMGAVLGGR